MKYVITFFLSLFLGLTLSMLRLGSAGAISNIVVISKVQLGFTGASQKEFISLFNKAETDVNITGWCLEFAAPPSSTPQPSFGEISCINTANTSVNIYLRAKSFVLFSRGMDLTADFIFSNPNNIPGTNGTIRLVDNQKEVIDLIGWGTGVAEGTSKPSLTAGKTFNRKTDQDGNLLDTDNNLNDFEVLDQPGILYNGEIYEVEVIIDVCPNIENTQLTIPSGFMIDDSGDCYEDICPNIDDLQIIIPSGYEMKPGSFNCTLIPLEDAILLITELVANAPSTDTGQEYIEIYNPLNRTVNLSGYKLQVGPNFTKEFIFANSDILAGQYKVFSDSETSIVLPNTTGVQLRLIAPAGNTVSETDVYSDAGDDVSWALVEDQWIYTNQITPGATNKPYLEPARAEVVGVTTVLAPCPDGKYRNPETNRCRAIETAVSQLAACNEDEYRNPETNRCRKASAVSILVACGTGKVRNPETKRCRSIAQANTLTDCTEGKVRNPETNRCRKISVLGTSTDSLPTVTDVAVESTTGQINWAVIVGVLAGTFAYIVYEWRSELSQFYGRIRAKLVQ